MCVYCTYNGHLPQCSNEDEALRFYGLIPHNKPYIFSPITGKVVQTVLYFHIMGCNGHDSLDGPLAGLQTFGFNIHCFLTV